MGIPPDQERSGEPAAIGTENGLRGRTPRHWRVWSS